MRPYPRSTAMRQFRFAATCVAVIGLAAPSHAMDKLRVGVPNGTAFMFAIVDLGVTTGIFEKRGIDIEKIAFEGGGKLEQAMAAGSVDIAATGSTDLLFTAKGVAEKAVAVFGGPPYSLGIIVRTDNSVRTPADLKGKKIGASTPGSLTEWLAHQFAIHQGWGHDGIISVPVGAMSAEIAALITKQVDGIVGPTEAGVGLEVKGQGKNLVNFGDILPHFVTYMMLASDSAMKNRPSDIRAFIAGWFETIAYMRTHKDASVAVMAKVMHLTPEIVAKIYDLEMPGCTDNGHFDKAAMKDLYDTLIAPKLEGKQIEVSSLYTEAFLPK
jgi:NitT/TauT family transport system substrate-binding protein